MKKIALMASLITSMCCFTFSTVNAAVSVQSPSLASKSQAFRHFLFSDRPSHTWPHINAGTPLEISNNSYLGFNTANQIAVPEPLINSVRQKHNIELMHSATSARAFLQVNLQLSQTEESTENAQNFALDGSLAGYALGNWFTSIGAVDRWWGPAWQSPLLLSTNARPIPAISLDRVEAKAPTLFGFRWIGPWHLSTFLGQLESDRVIANTLIWGIRVSAMPIQGFEIGLGRTAMFGGDGREVNGRALYNVITGQDNADDQPGNQLGSLDLAYRFSSNINHRLLGHEVYFELVGEDEAGGAPTKKFSTVGYTGFFYKDTGTKSQGAWHYLVEYSNTTAGSFGEQELNDIAYEHHIYQSGYTHHGRTIGSPLGGDTHATTVGLWLDQSVGVLGKSIGVWASRKHFSDQGRVHQLTLWTEQPCGILTCSLSFEGFNRPMKDQAINDTGERFAFSAGLRWIF